MKMPELYHGQISDCTADATNKGGGSTMNKRGIIIGLIMKMTDEQIGILYQFIIHLMH